MAGLADEGGRRPVRFRLWSGKLAVVQEDTSVCASEIHMHTIARIIPLSDDRSLLARMLARSTFSCSSEPPRLGVKSRGGDAAGRARPARRTALSARSEIWRR